MDTGGCLNMNTLDDKIDDYNRRLKKVFLGGTCAESTWREELIPLLKINYFNPVVEDWTPECMEEELRQRDTCDYCLYVITPRMLGVYSIAEVIDDSNKQPEKTVFAVIEPEGEKFDMGALKSLYAVGAMVVRNEGIFVKTLEDVAEVLNRSVK